ncbi:MAG: hypothetical protein FWE71_06510 [Nocardioidaceae bacterium]|nr:hypothetical protein [Nocardioidaceae bacterium]MCL2613645.1 hypothetical protein [Nocardioidaceae bacterium]
MNISLLTKTVPVLLLIATGISDVSAPATAETNGAATPHTALRGMHATTCSQWKELGSSSSEYRYCVKFNRKRTWATYSDKYQVDNTDSSQKTTLHCEVKHSKTWTQSGTVTVKTEAGLIFAKAETDFSGSITHSTSSEVGSGIVYKVRPHSWGHCVYGSSQLRVWGTRWKEVNSGRTQQLDVRSFRTTFPSTATWWTGPGQI